MCLSFLDRYLVELHLMRRCLRFQLRHSTMNLGVRALRRADFGLSGFGTDEFFETSKFFANVCAGAVAKRLFRKLSLRLLFAWIVDRGLVATRQLCKSLMWFQVFCRQSMVCASKFSRTANLGCFQVHRIPKARRPQS